MVEMWYCKNGISLRNSIWLFFFLSLDMFEIPENLTNIVSSTSTCNLGSVYSYFMYNAFLISFQA